jgi:hypothetical protein
MKRRVKIGPDVANHLNHTDEKLCSSPKARARILPSKIRSNLRARITRIGSHSIYNSVAEFNKSLQSIIALVNPNRVGLSGLNKIRFKFIDG